MNPNAAISTSNRDHVPDVDETTFLAETIAQWSNGESIDALAVMRRNPQLPTTLRIDLAYEEYCLRTARGEELDMASFCDRFTEINEELLKQLEVHRFLESAPDFFDDWSHSPKWPQVGDILAGYQIVNELGRGAFARVYRAFELALGNREVVVKVSRNDRGEAQILGRLNHPNIVPIHSVSKADERGLTVICMPYLGSTTLEDLIRERQLLRDDKLLDQKSLHFAIRVFASLLEALDAAHREGVLHLDVKPSNILIDDNRTPRLLDFNLAFDPLLASQAVGGTLGYMSPEQLTAFVDDKNSVLDGRSDLYSLGVVMLEYISGQPAHKSNVSCPRLAALEHLRASTSRPDPSFPDEVPHRLRAILRRCLATDPGDRFQSASVALIAIEELQQHITSENRDAQARTQRRLTNQRRMFWLAVTTFVVLASSIAGYCVFTSYQYALWLVSAGDYARAIPLLERHARTTKTAEIYSLLGFCCSKARHHRDACHWYLKAIQKGDNRAVVFNNLAYSTRQRGSKNGVKEWLDAAIASDDQLQAAYHNRALLDLDIAKKNRAIPVAAMSDIKMAIATGPPSMELLVDNARIFSFAASFDDSIVTHASLCIENAMMGGVDRRKLEQIPDVKRLMTLQSKLGQVASDRVLPEAASLIAMP